MDKVFCECGALMRPEGFSGYYSFYCPACNKKKYPAAGHKVDKAPRVKVLEGGVLEYSYNTSDNQI